MQSEETLPKWVYLPRHCGQEEQRTLIFAAQPQRVNPEGAEPCEFCSSLYLTNQISHSLLLGKRWRGTGKEGKHIFGKGRSFYFMKRGKIYKEDFFSMETISWNITTFCIDDRLAMVSLFWPFKVKASSLGRSPHSEGKGEERTLPWAALPVPFLGSLFNKFSIIFFQ